MPHVFPAARDPDAVRTGIILFSGNPLILEIAAAAGCDYVIIDMEHSPLDLEHCGHLIRAADAAGIAAIVRVPEVDAALIKKVLNLGAAGIAIPHATVTNCRAALAAARYAPEGERGACAVVRSAGYSPGDWNAHARAANRRVTVIPLLEDRAAIDDFEAMCAIDGIDVFFVGPTDLSIALGVPGATFDEPAMAATGQAGHDDDRQPARRRLRAAHRRARCALCGARHRRPSVPGCLSTDERCKTVTGER